MPKYSRDKGYEYQRTVAKILAKYMTPGEEWNTHFQSTPQSGGMKWKGDIQKSEEVKGRFPFHIECKNHKSIRLWDFIKQAEEDCPQGEIPSVIFHRHGTTKEYIAMPLEDLLKFLFGEENEDQG